MSSSQDGSSFGIFVAQSIHSDLSITKTADVDLVSPGDLVNFLITVSNAGPDAAPDVTITDSLDGTLAFVSASSSQGTGCTEDSGTVTCDLGTIDAGSDATIAITAELRTTFSNTATGTSGGFDPDGASTVTPTITIAQIADVPMSTEWALLVLGIILAIAGFVALRRW